MNEEKITDDEDKNTLSVSELVEDQPTVPVTPDEKELIEETLKSIGQIYKEGFVSTMLIIGEMLFTKIYGGDQNCVTPDKIAKKKTKPKRLLFEQLADKSDDLFNNGENMPRKTWLYNAVHIVADQKLLAGSSDYENLSISHRIALFPLGDKEKKLAAIQEIKSHKMSVRKAREHVSSVMSVTRPQSISYYISNPGEINFEDSFINNQIETITSDKKKESVIKGCEKKIKIIEEQIIKNQETLKKLQALLGRVKDTDLSTKKRRKTKRGKTTK